MHSIKIITLITLFLFSLPYPVNARNLDEHVAIPGAGYNEEQASSTAPSIPITIKFYLPIISTTAHHTPLVWYDFSGDFMTNGIVEDRSGNGHAAQVIGSVDATTGISGGQGIAFSGGYIQAQDNPVAGKTLVTFSLWFMTDNPAENYKLASAAWWHWGPGSGWIMATHIPEFWSDDNQSLYLPDIINIENNFPAGQWVHEAVTYDGVRIKEYTNGLLINDWATTGAPIGLGAPMVVGAWPPYSAYNFQGSLDEFKIFDQALTQEQIQEIYTQGRETSNHAPFFTSAPPLAATPEMNYTYTVSADDPDLRYGDELTISAPSLPVWLALTDHGNGSATLTGTPTSADVGQHTVVLRVTDHAGWIATQEFSISVAMVEPRTWHVASDGSDFSGDGTQANPFATIQHGIEAASHNDTVLVGPGVFRENINFLGKNITVGSLFMETGDEDYILQTVIDGSRNGHTITFANGESAQAQLSGFTITNGYANFAWPGSNGGGIYCDRADPTLTYLKVTNNEAHQEGGGLYFQHCAPIVRNVMVTNNVSGENGGGIRYSYGQVNLENVIVSSNTSRDGAGIQFYHAEGTVQNALIADNAGRGKGGGIMFDGCSPTFVNVTIVGNTTTGHGGGLNVSYMSQPTLVNSIVWGNSPEQIYYDTDWWGEAITIEHSDIQGGTSGIVTNGQGPVYWGEGNIDLSPRFINTNLGNYRLASDSPCIGTGKAAGTPILDIENNPRPNPAGSNPDMGAYESPLG